MKGLTMFLFFLVGALLLPKGQSFPAFSAVRSTSFTPSSAGLALPFDQVHTNIGDDFSGTTGRFTCEVPGLYLFTYSISTHNEAPLVYLMKNDVPINGVYREDEDLIDILSNTAVLQVNAGDEVWLSCRYSGVQIFSNEHLYTSFSGILQHESIDFDEM